MRLLEVPSSGADEQDGDVVVELVLLARLGVLERDLAPDGVAQVDLAVEQVEPRRRGRVLKVGHVRLGARVEGATASAGGIEDVDALDHHLAVDGAGDLDAAVAEAWS